MDTTFVAPIEEDLTSGVKTGLALANVEPWPVNVELEMIDEDGEVIASTALVIPPKGHIARFVNELDWSGGNASAFEATSLRAALRAKPSGRLSATVLQTYPGEMATMPVQLLDPPQGYAEPDYRQLRFAHYGDGQNGSSQLRTRLWLLNLSTNERAQLSVTFRDNSGTPASVVLSGTPVEGSAQYSIPPGAFLLLETEGTAELTQGSIQVDSDQPVAGVALFVGNNGIAGVGHSEPVEERAVAPVLTDLSEGTSTGLALMNLENNAASVVLTLRNSSGVAIALAEVQLAANGHDSFYLENLIWTPVASSLPDFGEFLGTVEMNSDTGFAATAIHTRPGQFATMPVAEK
jgi:hypothetical protein